MSANQNTEPTESPEFNLKHRVTGAAVLLFFGAAVLPWLLGPPSEASKVVPDVMVAQAADVPSDIEEAVLSIDGAQTIDVEESIYVSKITPLDANKKGELRKVLLKEPIAKVDETTKTTAVSLNPEDSTISEKPSNNKTAENQEKLAQENRAQEKAVKERKLKAQQEKLASDKRKKTQQETADAAASLKAKLVKEQVRLENKVDVGWIVQVGLFTEKDRAIAFISELKNKGFNASSNVVDTNRGKNTGTRVWLGPFARKASAGNEVKRLKAKAGKDGFIRVYP